MPKVVVEGDDVDLKQIDVRVLVVATTASFAPPSGGGTRVDKQPSKANVNPKASTPSVPLPPPAPVPDKDGTRYYTYRYQVPLRLGQKIGFRKGKGYYAYYPKEAPHSAPGLPTPSPPGPRNTPKRPAIPPATPPPKKPQPLLLPPQAPIGVTGHGELTLYKNQVYISGLGLANVTATLWAEVEFVGGAKDVIIGLAGDGISIKDGPLTVSDPEFYHWTKATAQTGIRAASGQHFPLRPGYPIELRLARTTPVTTPVGDIAWSTSAESDGTVTVELSVDKRVPVHGQDVNLAYGATTKIQPLPKSTPRPITLPEPPPWLVPVVALVLLYYFVAQPRPTTA